MGHQGNKWNLNTASILDRTKCNSKTSLPNPVPIKMGKDTPLPHPWSVRLVSFEKIETLFLSRSRSWTCVDFVNRFSSSAFVLFNSWHSFFRSTFVFSTSTFVFEVQHSFYSDVSCDVTPRSRGAVYIGGWQRHDVAWCFWLNSLPKKRVRGRNAGELLRNKFY